VPAPINDTRHAALVGAQAAGAAEYVIEWPDRSGQARVPGRDGAGLARWGDVAGAAAHRGDLDVAGGVGPWKAAGLVGVTVDMVRQGYGRHHLEHLRDAARALR